MDNWPPQQLFALFTTADGGVDLEHFAMAGFDEARSILLQVLAPAQTNAAERPCSQVAAHGAA